MAEMLEAQLAETEGAIRILRIDLRQAQEKVAQYSRNVENHPTNEAFVQLLIGANQRVKLYHADLTEALRKKEELMTNISVNIEQSKKLKIDDEVFRIKARSNERSKEFILVYNAAQNPRQLLQVPCLDFPRSWGRILSFLQAACVSSFDPANYVLSRWNVTTEIFESVSLRNEEMMIAGTYSYSSITDSGRLELTDERCTLIPTSKPNSASVSNSEGESSENVVRNASFTQRLMQRDCHCAVSKAFLHVTGSYILAFGWWKLERRQGLPTEIQSVISSLPGNINDIKNGILLDPTISIMFDSGEISFEYREDILYCVGIASAAKDYDGIAVHQNAMKRKDGKAWWCAETRPDPDLIKFHFRNSVFANLTGDVQDDDTDNGDEDAYATYVPYVG